MNKKEIMGIILFFLIFSIFIFQNQLSSQNLYSNDPHYHYSLSSIVLEEGNIKNDLDWCHEEENVQYISLSRIITPVLSNISSLNLIWIYKFFGAFCIAGAFLFLILSIKKLTKSNKSLILISFLFSLFYLLWRSLITYPENMGLLFISLGIYSFVNSHYRLAIISLITLSYTHMPSAFIGLLFFIPVLIKEYNKDKKKTITYFSIMILLLLPLFPYLLIKLNDYYNLHFSIGKPAEIFLQETNLKKYATLTLSDYVKNLGAPIIIFSIAGLAYVFKQYKDNYLKFTLIVSSLLLILLTNGFFGIFSIPYYRMLSFLSIISFFIGGIYFINKDFNKYIKIILIFLLVILSMLILQEIKGSNDISDEDILFIEELKNIEGVKIGISPKLRNLMVEDTECNSTKINNFFLANSNKEIEENIKES